MATIKNIMYFGPYASGFSISVDDMEVGVGDGHFGGVNFAAASFSVAAPSAGTDEWAVYAMSDGSMQDIYGGGMPSGSFEQKIIWTNVASGDTTLESHEFIRYLPIVKP